MTEPRKIPGVSVVARPQGPVCQSSAPQNVSDGTMCLAQTPPPRPLGVCSNPGAADNSWGYWDVVVWKILPKRIGGDPDILRKYKDAWVHDHRDLIKSLSKQYGLPPELLGGVAWIEAGGKPYNFKLWVYDFRAFDHSGDPLVEPLTISKKPGFTSIGPVAIQLRRAAETLDLDYDQLSDSDKDTLMKCLQSADSELAVVARHLWKLKQIDFAGQKELGKYEIRIIATRYNRGPDLTLKEILRNTSYGDFIIYRKYDQIQKLLE
jgi:hypothetical protein